MSTQTPAFLPCPECGHHYKSLVAVVINLPKRPDLYEALMSDRLNVMTCPKCAKEVRFLRTVATVDFERKEWVYGFPETLERHWQDLALMTEAAFRKNVRQAAPAMVRESADEWKVRTVLGYEGLREQRVMSDAGVDDVRIETAKLNLLRGRPEWSGARIHLRAVRADELLWRVRSAHSGEGVLVQSTRAILDEGLPAHLLPGALGADSFVSFRRYLIDPVPADPRVLNLDGRWDIATGAGDPREPLIRI